MKIGIDIDGVIVDTINLIAKELSTYLKRVVSPYEVAHELGNIDGIDAIFEEKGAYFFDTLDPYDLVVDAINELNKYHEVYIISARFHHHYDLTLNWMKTHGLMFSKVVFTEGKSKVSECEKYGIEIFVEDSIVNATELADSGIKVIIYTTDYNKDFQREGVIRCGNWTHVLDVIG